MQSRKLKLATYLFLLIQMLLLGVPVKAQWEWVSRKTLLSCLEIANSRGIEWNNIKFYQQPATIDSTALVEADVILRLQEVPGDRFGEVLACNKSGTYDWHTNYSYE